jgi:hypothetical protein
MPYGLNEKYYLMLTRFNGRHPVMTAWLIGLSVLMIVVLFLYFLALIGVGFLVGTIAIGGIVFLVFMLGYGIKDWLGLK